MIKKDCAKTKWLHLFKIFAITSFSNHCKNFKQMKKVIIVEDEAIVALEIESILEDLGYQVIGIAHNGDKALDFFHQSKKKKFTWANSPNLQLCFETS